MSIIVANSNADPFNQALVDALGPIAQPADLPYGDAIFVGLWSQNQAVRVLIERKRTLDFLSSMLNGHHLKQAQDAKAAGFDFIYLVVEGEEGNLPFTFDAERMVAVPRGPFLTRLNEIPTMTGHLPDLEYRRVDSYLNQLDLYLGVRTRLTTSVWDTAEWLTDLYHLFQTPPEKHNTFKNAWKRTTDPKPERLGDGFLTPPSLLEKVVMQFPNIGWARAHAIAEEFKTMEKFMQTLSSGDIGSLCEVPGVGPGIAKKIFDGIRES